MREAIELISLFVLPTFIIFLPLYGLYKRVPVYEQFIVGARDGFSTAVNIIPYLVAILFAMAMFSASGAMDMLTDALRPIMQFFGIPAEILPMAIIRPLTGSGSQGVLLQMVQKYGADSFFVRVAGTIYASSETTFYVLAVYFGAVNIKKTRHALPAGLIADFAGVILAVWLVRWLLR
ncbi:MAG TPA: nucleoside recognition domain-containing protein [Tepidisphaeraceae bacterium]|jgi:spore maturation protein B|nr:nucleoside recognition domain-containing protein [Tepidisphaeraceae bacterium]